MRLSLFITADFFRKNVGVDFHSYRCREVDGVFQIRPTGRTNVTQLIKGQDLVNISQALLGYDFKVPFQVGSWGLEPSGYGWFTLVPDGTDILISVPMENEPEVDSTEVIG